MGRRWGVAVIDYQITCWSNSLHILVGPHKSCRDTIQGQRKKTGSVHEYQLMKINESVSGRLCSVTEWLMFRFWRSDVRMTAVAWVQTRNAVDVNVGSEIADNSYWYSSDDGIQLAAVVHWAQLFLSQLALYVDRSSFVKCLTSCFLGMERASR